MGLISWWKVKRAKRWLNKRYEWWEVRQEARTEYGTEWVVVARRTALDEERTIAVSNLTEREAIISGGLRAYYELEP